MNVLHKTAITLTPNHLDIITKKKEKHTYAVYRSSAVSYKNDQYSLQQKSDSLKSHRYFFINKRKGAIS